jgi:flagellar basal-body rod modification protein FlgD
MPRMLAGNGCSQSQPEKKGNRLRLRLRARATVEAYPPQKQPTGPPRKPQGGLKTLRKDAPMSVTDVTTSSRLLQSLSSNESSETTAEKSSGLGQEEFLTILMAQMQNQNPLEPMDSTDYTAQLTQFSSLEQQINTNSYLSAILENLDAGTEGDLLDYIGKEIATDTGSLTLSGGKAESISFTLEETADVEMVIYDSEGNEILRSSTEGVAAGTYDISWDGTDADGNRVEDGAYTYRIRAYDEAGDSVAVSLEHCGIVTGVTYQDGKPYLLVNGSRVDPENVQEVRLAEDNG